jgi:hypothetical protein
MKYLKNYKKFENSTEHTIDTTSPMTDECQLAFHKFVEDEDLSKKEVGYNYVENLQKFLNYQEEIGDPNDWIDSIKSELDTFKDSFVRPFNK